MAVLTTWPPPPFGNDPMTRKPQLNTIPELLDDIRAGRMVVLMDDADRENVGDLVLAAS